MRVNAKLIFLSAGICEFFKEISKVREFRGDWESLFHDYTSNDISKKRLDEVPQVFLLSFLVIDSN